MSTNVWPRQPFVGLGLAAVTGILLAELSPHPLLALGILPLAAAAAWRVRRPVVIHVFAALAFFALHSLRQTESPGLRLARTIGFAPQAAAVRGLITSEPQMSERGMASFHLRLRWIERDGARRSSNATILARWRGAARYGDEVQLFGVMQPTEGPRNPGEFDMRAYLARRDIRHVLIVRYPENGKVIAASGGNPILRAAHASRRWMQAALARGLEDSPDRHGLISGIVLGLRDETADEVEEQFQQTGTIHLFAVSGLHVGIVAYLLWTLARAARLPRRRAIALIIPALFFYSAITGLNTSSVRAALMATFLLGGSFFDRKASPANNVAAAGVCILAVDPNQLFATGFQLSFAVVISIIAFAETLFRTFTRWAAPDPLLPVSLLHPGQRLGQKAWRALSGAASVSLAAWIGSLPLILPYFYLITPVSLFANLAVVPIAFFVLAVGLMSLLTTSIAPGLALLFNNANWSLAAVILATVEFFTHAPAGHFYLELPHRPTGTRVEMTALDLGAGAALHLRSAQRDWLVDCGGARDFRRIIASYLRSRGVNRLDGVILTHGDAGHIGAAGSILRAFQPRSWYDTAAPDRSRVHRDLIALLERRQIPRQFCFAPNELTLSP